MTSADFVDAVITQVPEAEPTVREHFEEMEGELLLHLLMADLQRLAGTWFNEENANPLERLLAVLDAGLTEGDERVENAVAVSFVENTGWWDPAMQPFMAVWPHALQAEARNQRDYRA